LALLALFAGYFSSRKGRKDREAKGLGALGVLCGIFFSPAKVAKTAKRNALALFAGYLLSPAKYAKIAKYRALALFALLAGYFSSRKGRKDREA
jgi:lipopolysaccharide export LptBFGC system permease protein LptF